MRILYLGNNWVAWQVLKWLKEQGEEVVGLVIHPPLKQEYALELVRVVDLPPNRVYDGSQLQKLETFNAIKVLDADIAVSVLFDYIFNNKFLRLFPHGVINLHPAYLPYNRGQYPNVWSIIEGTPSGTTLHYIDDEGIDTGDIIAQKEVPVDPIDTGETLYHKLEKASVELFKETWPLIKTGKALRFSQGSRAGTYHRVQDVRTIDEIDLNRTYVARDLINILRSRTFPPYKGAFFGDNGKKVYMRLHLEYGEEG
jgi:methionyl-tRNA formyltransferase